MIFWSFNWLLLQLKLKGRSVNMEQQRTKSNIPGKSDLVLNERFTYEFFERNRYTISEEGDYQALCNNGFIKLYSKLCRVYWHTQNEFGHETMDWKFHISVAHQDLRKAWNLIAAVFLKMKCRAGIKTIYLKEAQNPQKGREITLYLIKFDPKFKQSLFAGDFGLAIDIEHSEDYWFQLCRTIEEVLSSYEVEPNGLADGDYPLGKYISFRNEAFVRNSMGESVYPPNDVGWNPLHYPLPIDLQKFKTIRQDSHHQISILAKFRPLVFVSFAIVGLVFWWKSRQGLKK